MGNAVQEENMRELAGFIDEVLSEIYGRKMGFILNVASFESKGKVGDYIGNVGRNTAVNWLRESSIRLAKGQYIPAPTSHTKH